MIPIGFLSIGILPLGIFAIGLLAFGTLALGILAAGSIAAGIFSFGAISAGIVSFGAISVGEFAMGALSYGHYFAYVDHAQAMFAFGESEAVGSVFECLIFEDAYDKSEVFAKMYDEVPVIYHWIVDIIKKYM